MQQRPSTVQVAPGDDVVARFRDVVLYTDARGEAIGALLAAVENASAAAHPGDVLAGQLATVVFGVATSAAVGVIAPGESGFVVLLHGPASAVVETTGGVRRLTGGHGPAWTSETFSDEVPTVALTPLGARPVSPDPHSDLRGGVVPAGGCVMVGELRTDGSDIVKTVHIKKADIKPAGIKGKDLNQPVSRETATVRFAAMGETSVAISVSGALTGPNNAVYPLDRSYVVGRAPLSDDAVRSAAASPIVVPYDPYVSRVHAYVTVQGTEVYVRDAGTASGTYVAAPGAHSWSRLGPAPTRIEPGWSLRVGEWIAVLKR